MILISFQVRGVGREFCTLLILLVQGLLTPSWSGSYCSLVCVETSQGVLLPDYCTHAVPTIAAINGHCYAGGMMLSLACDYRIMTDGSKRNAWLCMNEVALQIFNYRAL